MRDAVTVSMQASPDVVWALLSDVTRIGELSPETFEAHWLDGASGPALGARFRGHVNRNGKGVKYWTVCKVTACDPGRSFGFDVLAGSRAVNSWRYDIVPTDPGCDVTESFALTPAVPMRLYWAVAGRLRGRTNREGMQRTLERAKALVEVTSSTP